jgi:SNF2 family DNA or RNA helicase
MRLQQITCGHFVADDGTVQTIKNNRLDELMDVLEETENKAIIWAYWQRDVQDIRDAIEKKYGPRSVVDYYGLTPQDERQDNIRRFQNDNECRFLIGTPSTGGYGITLTEANTVIYYSKNVTYIDLIAEDTVDEKIVRSLRKKINIASEVMGEELRDWI